MIGAIMAIRWIGLKRDRVALLMTFILPIIFFSIFAAIFGNMSTGGGGGGGTGETSVVIADEDQTEISARFVEALEAQDGIGIVRHPAVPEGEIAEAFDRESARAFIREGHAPVAVVIPEGFGETFGTFDPEQQKTVDVIYDAANPIAQYTVTGMMQAAAMQAAPDLLMENGFDMLEEAGGFLTVEQREIMDDLKPFLRGDQPWSEFEGGEDDAEAAPADAPPAEFSGLVQVRAVEARADEDDDGDDGPEMVSYYAAGIGVMFLLFSMAGAGGVFLEEEEMGTIERVLSSRASMMQMIVASWLFFSIVGVAQLILMFVWGAVVFGLELWTANHIVGFLAMTLVTSTAASGFGILLATLCRSRGQLSGLSTVVILIMSAMGGSMVPRFVMPSFMETTGKFTINGWALDGYLDVFWYGDPDASIMGTLASIALPLAMLTALSVVFLGLARVFARRWETV